MDFTRYRVVNTQKQECSFMPSELDRIVEDLQQQNQARPHNFMSVNTTSEAIPDQKPGFAAVFGADNPSNNVGMTVKKQNLFWIHILAFITCLFSIAALIISLVMNYQIWPWLWSHK